MSEKAIVVVERPKRADVVAAGPIIPVGGAPGGTSTPDWADVQNKPATFPPDAHSHPAPAWADVQSKPATFPPEAHTHSYEPELGNPDTDGKILSSTAAGVRSWIAAPAGGGGGMTLLDTADFGVTPAGSYQFNFPGVGRYRFVGQQLTRSTSQNSFLVLQNQDFQNLFMSGHATIYGAADAELNGTAYLPVGIVGAPWQVMNFDFVVDFVASGLANGFFGDMAWYSGATWDVTTFAGTNSPRVLTGLFFNFWGDTVNGGKLKVYKEA